MPYPYTDPTNQSAISIDDNAPILKNPFSIKTRYTGLENKAQQIKNISQRHEEFNRKYE